MTWPNPRIDLDWSGFDVKNEHDFFVFAATFRRWRGPYLLCYSGNRFVSQHAVAGTDPSQLVELAQEIARDAGKSDQHGTFHVVVAVDASSDRAWYGIRDEGNEEFFDKTRAREVFSEVVGHEVEDKPLPFAWQKLIWAAQRAAEHIVERRKKSVNTGIVERISQWPQLDIGFRGPIRRLDSADGAFKAFESKKYRVTGYVAEIDGFDGSGPVEDFIARDAAGSPKEEAGLVSRERREEMREIALRLFEASSPVIPKRCTMGVVFDQVAERSAVTVFEGGHPAGLLGMFAHSACELVDPAWLTFEELNELSDCAW